MENRIMTMKYLLLALSLFSSLSFAQQLSYPLPRDARDNVLYFGVGNPYAFELTATTSSYTTGVRYQLPTSGNDVKRVYRHLYVYNPDSTRIVYICFGDSSGCSTDSYKVRPGFGLVFEPIRFGEPVGTGYVYMRLDSAGSVTADLSAW